MKNKIIFLFVISFVITSCWISKTDEKIENGNIADNVVENNVQDNHIQSQINDEELVETGSVKTEIEINNDLTKDKNNYIKLEKMELDKILAYDCKSFKTNDFIQWCLMLKNSKIPTYMSNMFEKWKETKLKKLKAWDLSVCENYLKTKDEEWYFNCSLAIIVANEKVKCSDIKNVGNFTKYFWKTCDEVVVEMNKYIEEKALEKKYEKMLKWFWWEGGNMWNIDLNEVYLNEVLNRR